VASAISCVYHHMNHLTAYTESGLILVLTQAGFTEHLDLKQLSHSWLQ